MISQMPDLTKAFGTKTGPQAIKMSGINLEDIDLAMIYDSFTFTVLVSLENIGFCNPGEGAEFLLDKTIYIGDDYRDIKEYELQ